MWFISAAVMGYSVRHLGVVDRAVYGIAGICLLLPVGAFAAARWFNIAGALLAVGAVRLRADARRKQPEQAAHRDAAAAAPVAPAPAATAPAATDRATLDRMGVRGTGEGE